MDGFLRCIGVIDGVDCIRSKRENRVSEVMVPNMILLGG